MRSSIRAFCTVCLGFGAALLIGQSVAASRAGHINVASIVGSINPASADYLIEAIATSERVRR